ncbi:MAG TPA: sigma-70 family RNA polymerase sigma factor [Caldilineae bacterium]|nr:sigma-70 family RNA polymerase sigma factor [Caldilineae bacterium]
MEEEMQVPDVLAELINQASAQGYITYDDILQVLPDAEQSMEILEELFARLQERGIPLLEESEVEQAMAAELEGERLQESDEEAVLADLSTSDATDLYFREMGRARLLTPEEETTLARQVVAARKAKRRLREEPDLDPAERAKLKRIIRRGKAARRRMVEANTRLVISIAKRYIGQGVPFLDLIQEGNIGLMRAVDRFDPERGYKFSTYATWWIRQAVSRAVADQSRTIRLPVHVGEKLLRLRRASQMLEQELGRAPSPEEVAEVTELPADRVRGYLQVATQPLSLEQPVGEEEDSTLGQFIEDEDSPAPPEAVEQGLLRERINELLDTLSPREARILRMRYGLYDGHSYTLKEIGDKFGLTRERIRQIEAEALSHLRHPSRSRLLRDFVD